MSKGASEAQRLRENASFLDLFSETLRLCGPYVTADVTQFRS